MKPGSYEKLNENGMVGVNTYVDSNDIIIGKVIPLKDKGNTKQIYRLDYEQNLNDSFSKLIIKQIKKISKDYDSVILSDYNKGVLNKDTISFIIKYFDCPVIVDPKKNDFSIYQNATALTPNLTELEKATSSSLRSNKSIEKVCNSLLHDFNLKFIVLLYN